MKEFLTFGLKQAQAAIFAGSFFALLFISNHIPLFGLARYDFLFISAVLIQAVLYFTKLETGDEVKVIFLFHIIGLVLELYKTSPGVASWSYPESAFFKIATVPLYSGFMYAAVGSYISQAWRIFKLELTHYEHYVWSLGLCFLIYINFFTNHFFYDFRIFLIIAVFALFWKTKVYFTVTNVRRTLTLNTSFLLIAFFVWIAENISTYFGAWQYPNQIHSWTLVSTNKITSWFLMVIISFILVAYLKHFKKTLQQKNIHLVHFLSSEEIFDKAGAVFADEKKKLEKIIPNTDIQHVGSSSIPGALGKFDIDIQIRVEQGRFEEILTIMQNLYHINHKEIWTNELAIFKDRRENDVDLMLTVIGSKYDEYYKLRDYFIANPDALEQYNDLKKQYEGKPYHEYRSAKTAFLGKNGENKFLDY